MEYFVNLNDVRQIGSTLYFEFQEGTYKDECWLDSSIYISDEIWKQFYMTKFIGENVENFDYYGVTQINKEQWKKIVYNSQVEDCVCKDVIKEAIPWVNSCFENNEFFSIVGI